MRIEKIRNALRVGSLCKAFLMVSHSIETVVCAAVAAEFRTLEQFASGALGFCLVALIVVDLIHRRSESTD